MKDVFCVEYFTLSRERDPFSEYVTRGINEKKQPN